MYMKGATKHIKMSMIMRRFFSEWVTGPLRIDATFSRCIHNLRHDAGSAKFAPTSSLVTVCRSEPAIEDQNHKTLTDIAPSDKLDDDVVCPHNGIHAVCNIHEEKPNNY